MKKTDNRQIELMSMIANSDNPETIKGLAKLISKMNRLVEEEGKLQSLVDSINQLSEEISEDLQRFKAAEPAKPKSNRGRKKKVA